MRAPPAGKAIPTLQFVLRHDRDLNRMQLVGLDRWFDGRPADAVRAAAEYVRDTFGDRYTLSLRVE